MRNNLLTKNTSLSVQWDSANYTRRASRVVDIGDVPMGGAYPIRVQSMTTLNTMDTEGVVAQSIRLIEAGSEYVRITAPSLKDAKNLEVIKKQLRNKGYTVPLIADIHFTPNAAEWAARVVEKVRINPGNYADKKRFEHIEYTAITYQSELERVRKKFLPLVRICKEYGTVMRIGVNHGSLSDRIMSRYGDTPLGMVESALEFVRICEDQHYYDIVLSMKSSNPKVMIQAYHLLVKRLERENRLPYPLHLGVTEAGDGDEGRIKSAIGIGTLLEEGLGDTIRVSLTEEPEYEIPAAKILANRRFTSDNASLASKDSSFYTVDLANSSYRAKKILNIGHGEVPRVIADLSASKSITSMDLSKLGYRYMKSPDKWHIADTACDYVYVGDRKFDINTPQSLGVIYNYNTWLSFQDRRGYPLFTPFEYLTNTEQSRQLNFINLHLKDISTAFIQKIRLDHTVVLLLNIGRDALPAQRRALFERLNSGGCQNPVVIRGLYTALTWEETLLYAATDMGSFFLEGLGNGLLLTATNHAADKMNRLAFKLLQGARARISKTEYISCPSCGRTLFSLQETTAKIKAKTNHLKGIKIGIMGCIVNGPGEMADADYGYVGSGKGKITLYRGKEVVQRAVPSDKAVEELIKIIREDGKWVEAE